MTMTRAAGTAAATLFAATLGLAAATVSDDQVITRRFPLAAGGAAPEVVVSLVNGPIRVTAHEAAEVVLDAKVHLEASDAGRLAELKNRVRLESEQSGQNVWIGVEADWDNWNGRGGGTRRATRELGWRGKTEARGDDSAEREYSRFRHEVELRVPRQAHLKLRTVNGGEIAVTGVEGEFDLSTVNGGIALQGAAAGFGKARTVNGPVMLGFSGHPTGAIRARTVNGTVTLAFQPGLNATLRVNNRHGVVTTDFPLLTAAAAGGDGNAKPEEKGMKRIWSSGRAPELRAGSGTGPVIEAQTVNGAIRILENRK